MNREQWAEGRGQRYHDADSGRNAEQSAGEAEAECLQEKYAQQIGGIRADGLENGQRVHVLLKVRVHGHGDADSAEHHGDQADEAEDRGRIVEPAGERRVAFAEVDYLRIRQRRFQLLAHRGSLRRGGEAARRNRGQLDEQAARCAASGSH